MLNDICYIPCNYSKNDFDNKLYEKEIGIDIKTVDGERLEIFTQKEYIHPINDKKAMLTVKLLKSNDKFAVIGLPGAELLNGRTIAYVAVNIIKYYI